MLHPETKGHSPDLSKASIFFVGTANIIMKIAGFSTLEDPNVLHAGEHDHLGYDMKSKRLTNPALDLKDAPWPIYHAMPQGGTRVLGLMVTMDDEQGLETMRLILVKADDTYLLKRSHDIQVSSGGLPGGG